jgi:hypothetical protein
MNLDLETSSTIPRTVNATKSPYVTSNKRPADPGTNFFFGENPINAVKTKNKVIKGQEDMTCRACGSRGHSARFCNDGPPAPKVNKRQSTNVRLKERDCITYLIVR